MKLYNMFSSNIPLWMINFPISFFGGGGGCGGGGLFVGQLWWVDLFCVTPVHVQRYKQFELMLPGPPSPLLLSKVSKHGDSRGLTNPTNQTSKLPEGGGGGGKGAV